MIREAGELKKVLLPAIKAFAELEGGETDFKPGQEPRLDPQLVKDVSRNPSAYDFSISPGKFGGRKVSVLRKNDNRHVGDYEISKDGWVIDLYSGVEYNPTTKEFS